jgi:hypothetical protein
MRTQDLETRRKGVNGEIKDKESIASASSIPLCFKGFHFIREAVAGLIAKC